VTWCVTLSGGRGVAAVNPFEISVQPREHPQNPKSRSDRRRRNILSHKAFVRRELDRLNAARGLVNQASMGRDSRSAFLFTVSAVQPSRWSRPAISVKSYDYRTQATLSQSRCCDESSLQTGVTAILRGEFQEVTVLNRGIRDRRFLPRQHGPIPSTAARCERR
jgi:hypothetical protein